MPVEKKLPTFDEVLDDPTLIPQMQYLGQITRTATALCPCGKCSTLMMIVEFDDEKIASFTIGQEELLALGVSIRHSIHEGKEGFLRSSSRESVH